jgi:hypothetical protein
LGQRRPHFLLSFYIGATTAFSQTPILMTLAASKKALLFKLAEFMTRPCAFLALFLVAASLSDQPDAATTARINHSYGKLPVTAAAAGEKPGPPR